MIANQTALVTVAMFIDAFPKISLCFFHVIVVTPWVTEMIHSEKDGSFVMRYFVFEKSLNLVLLFVTTNFT